jgi:hypothetical protein
MGDSFRTPMGLLTGPEKTANREPFFIYAVFSAAGTRLQRVIWADRTPRPD